MAGSHRFSSNRKLGFLGIAAKPGLTEATLSKVPATEGVVMGAPQHMTPGQVEGKEADARSDIWAFGAVLFEMVTGQKAFQGGARPVTVV